MSTINSNISSVLFSKTQQHVLGLLYGQPEIDFHTNEVIRQTHSGTGAVQRELLRLTSAGILTVKQIGNQKRYQANQASPLFTELQSIVLKTFGLADIIKEAISPLSTKITLAFIYGSIAKQQDTVHSDIDLMFIGEDITYADVFHYLSPVEIQLSRKINPTFYSSKEWIRKKTTKNHFVEQLLQQPKIFLIGTENELSTLG